jgi:hypothetical protein
VILVHAAVVAVVVAVLAVLGLRIVAAGLARVAV